MKRKQEVSELAVSLFEAIDRAKTQADVASVGAIADKAMPAIDKAYPDLGFELWLWLGLKQDGEQQMAEDYRVVLLEEIGKLRR